MAVTINQRYGEIPTSQDEAYFPYPLVRDELIDNDHVPINTVASVLDSIRQGIMPEKGAVVSLGSGICGAFDLVAVERVTDREAVIVPAKKDVVHKRTDRIMGRSVLILSNDEGDLKVLGAIERHNGHNHTDDNCKLIGEYVLEEYGINSPKYHIVQDESGVLVCRSPMSMPRHFIMG